MRSYASELQCHGGELQAWARDAQGVCDVAKALVKTQCGAMDDGNIMGIIDEEVAKLERD